MNSLQQSFKNSCVNLIKRTYCSTKEQIVEVYSSPLLRFRLIATGVYFNAVSALGAGIYMYRQSQIIEDRARGVWLLIAGSLVGSVVPIFTIVFWRTFANSYATRLAANPNKGTIIVDTMHWLTLQRKSTEYEASRLIKPHWAPHTNVVVLRGEGADLLDIKKWISYLFSTNPKYYHNKELFQKISKGGVSIEKYEK
eukprot:TRINITY_DN9696_c0_g1_i1.p1 TRINITY_DN9696_c0_g1~~TRINITY_DN9696_c0_g1_i1.p1  ORF type:complete len:197 (+),score=9.12 TRINITY_DN9696_c0_g1_i1:1-591(+)